KCSRVQIVSELKCCKRCGAFTTCDHKGECCVECEYFDPVDIICMAPPEVKAAVKIDRIEEDDEEVDPATFLFDDDDFDDDDTSDLPPKRESSDDVDNDDWD
ncbi:MAG: hypothetical protein ACTSSD_13090, partial [Candidatus Thorarchaeota archaeon]